MKKLVATFFCLLMLSGICSGCGNETEITIKQSTESNSITQLTESEKIDETEEFLKSDAVTVDSSDSTSDEVSDDALADIYTMNFSEGAVTLPCQVKDLTFLEIDESSLVSSFGYTVGYISYDKSIIGRIFLDETETDKELPERMVVGIEVTLLSAYKYANITADYKGLTLNDTREKLEEVLGEPDSEILTSSQLSYPLDEEHTEQYVAFQIDSLDDVIETIGLYIK